MKRLQTPGMVDGDDKNDMEDMEYMEHWGEDEDQVLKTMEKNPNKKAKEEKIKKMLIEAMATHEALTKNFFESNLKKKETHRFTSYVTYNLSMRCPIWASMFLSKTLVLTNYCNMDITFSTMVEKWL